MLLAHRGLLPRMDPSAFIEESASIIGDVVIGSESSVWFHVVIRGDVNFIRIGNRTNIQDGSVIHVTRETHPTILGDEITVGHNATLHGCIIGARCLVGIGAVVLDGAEIGEGAMVAAGSVVSPGTIVPPGTLVMGTPARVKRSLTEVEIKNLKQSADNYVGYMREYRALAKPR
jgi:carbonic anhydrase/acetyltransferase-like protein (isoleucine patch superfamily)